MKKINPNAPDNKKQGENLLETEEYTHIDSEKLFLHSHNNMSVKSSSQIDIPENIES